MAAEANEELGKVAIPEGVLQNPDAVLGHSVERRGPDGGRILAHLSGQVDQRDDHAKGAHELAQAAEVLEGELAEHSGLRPRLGGVRLPRPTDVGGPEKIPMSPVVPQPSPADLLCARQLWGTVLWTYEFGSRLHVHVTSPREELREGALSVAWEGTRHA